MRLPLRRLDDLDRSTSRGRSRGREGVWQAGERNVLERRHLQIDHLAAFRGVRDLEDEALRGLGREDEVLIALAGKFLRARRETPELQRDPARVGCIEPWPLVGHGGAQCLHVASSGVALHHVNGVA